jgi:hypothetical protein
MGGHRPRAVFWGGRPTLLIPPILTVLVQELYIWGRMHVQNFDPMQYFSWKIFLAIAIFYTGLEFAGELLRNDIFSERNARPLSAIFGIHLGFLVFLLGLMLASVYISTALPYWATETFRVRGGDFSALDVLYVIAIFGLHNIEQRLVYVKADRNDSRRAGGAPTLRIGKE